MKRGSVSRGVVAAVVGIWLSRGGQTRANILDIAGTADQLTQYGSATDALAYSWMNMSAALRAAAGTVDSANDLSNLGLMLQHPGIWVDLRNDQTGPLTATETANLTTYLATGRRVVLIGGNANYSNWDTSILNAVGGGYFDRGVVSKTTTARLYTTNLNANVANLYLPSGGVADSNGNASNTLFQARVATLWGPCANALVVLDPNALDDDEWNTVPNNKQFGTNAAAWVAGALPLRSSSLWNTTVSGSSWTDTTGGAWALNERPSIGDDATFNLAADARVAAGYTVAVTAPVTVADVLVPSDRVTLGLTAAGSLTVAKNIVVGQGNYAFLTLAGSTISAAAAVVSPTGSLTVAAGTQLDLAGPVTGGGTVVVNGNVRIGPARGSAGTIASLTGAGLIDLTDTDLILTATNLSAATNLVTAGVSTGTTGIVSTAVDTAHRMAIGVVRNNQGGTPLFSAGRLFDGLTPDPADVLLKYTAVGDANLDGKIDGSDYTLIDNGYNQKLTGWYNGDFNYDGVVNGSDYSLIDNAFNTQQPAGNAIVAIATDQIAAVPEPAPVCGALLAAAVAARRKRG